MPREWSLTVEDFGRIERAEVTVKPLTVLVGPNNSGKSYLGTLIWGIESGGLNVVGLEHELLDGLLQRWIARAEQSELSWVPWNDDERRAFSASWPSYVSAALPDCCRVLFDSDGLRPSKMMLVSPALDETWYLAAGTHPSDGSLRLRTIQLANRRDMTPEENDLALRINFDANRPPRVWPIAGYVAGFSEALMSSEYARWSPVYLPASRTGFSLFLPTFLQASLTGTLVQPRRPPLHAKSVEPRSSSRFTLPQIHLLSGLTTAFGGTRGPFADEADRLEGECLDGTVVVRAETRVANYAFRPGGTSNDLGLQLSSALVTELMPFVVLLRYAQQLPFLVIEEPEAHLHPKLQRIVTRCLCRLVRRGVRVLITTHSATVAQQINNLVKLGGLAGERRAELQRRFYDGSDEHLDGNDVAMHEFRFREDGRSIVERVELSAWGFPLPTFNEDLHRLTEETLALNSELEPEADR